MTRFLSIAVLTLSASTLIACGDDEASDDDNGSGNASSGGNGSGAAGSGGAGTGGQNTGGIGQGGFATGGAGQGGQPGDDDAPLVNLTFSGGCTPDFGGTISVAVNNESIAVYSQNGGGGADSSIQLALQGATGLQTLSTQHRIDTGIVINVIDDFQTWTNIATTMPDPIGGTMDIVANDQNNGIVEVTFTNATVVLPGNEASQCVINGTLETFGAYFGQ